MSTLTGGGGTTLHTHTLANGASDVTATAAEVNQALAGISANVTDTNLSTLTGGGDTSLHRHSNATTSVDGFMAASDKTKLDGLTGPTFISAKNASQITGLSSTKTLVTLASMDVISGDRVYIEARVQYSTSTSAGRAVTKILKDSGTATIVAFHDLTSIDHRAITSDIHPTDHVISGFFKVTGSGTLVLKMTGSHEGTADGTSSANTCQLIAYKA